MTTPSLLQYLKIKEHHSECLVFYRIGEFYELFFEDALIVSSALNIVLTKRGKYQEKEIPMCGIPFHSSDNYISNLVRLGHKIAICEQVETPEEAKKRGNKAIINREVVQIITPGTAIADNLLDVKYNNYILCIAQEKSGNFAFAWADLSIQKFYFYSIEKHLFFDFISEISPKEILISESIYCNMELCETLKLIDAVISRYKYDVFDAKRAEKTLKSFYQTSILDSIAIFSKYELISAGVLLDYIISTQVGRLKNFALPVRYNVDEFMILDNVTIKSLELFKNVNGERKGSLVEVIDYTLTASGARLLRENLIHPLTSISEINNRLDMVDFFYSNIELRTNIRNILKNIRDFERSLSRVLLSRAEPRDLLIVREGLKSNLKIAKLLSGENFSKISNLEEIYGYLGQHTELINTLEEAIHDNANKKSEAGYIKEDFNSKLLQLKCLMDNAEKLLFDLCSHYKQLTGLHSLKISSNNLIGYYIEVSASSKLDSDLFIHKQSLSNVTRYTTSELKDLEYKIINAKNSYETLEKVAFEDLCLEVGRSSKEIYKYATIIAQLDLSLAFAELAEKLDLKRPVVTDDNIFIVKNGRHIVVESRNAFVANDTFLGDDNRIILLTGPNMAGKSTYLRQNALIIIMAQIGSFVPADFSRIGVVDRVFTRIGASDNISVGKSTFMVEMVETASIVNMATEKSFVILDELGRGTGTYDGVAIAHSVIEYLHDINKCRSIFATHYYELCELENSLPMLHCYTMRVVEQKSEVIFMHEVMRGHIGKSYGIYVAKISGMPNSIIKRAEKLLNNYKKKEKY